MTTLCQRRRVGFAIWAVAAAFATAWLVEALAVGRGLVSTYFAPLAIVGNLLGVFLMGGFSFRSGSDSPPHFRAGC